MPGNGPLDDYRAKRDFSRTPEPPPAPGGPTPADAPRFVVQRHDARALHFDLRLEEGGALASWAVPKGPPLRAGPRRLAVRTEDHPLEYLTFAAVIPEGQYGAGRMTVWDSGTFETLERTGSEWKLALRGQVLQGEYHLVRTGVRAGREEWLLFRSTRSGGPGAPDPVPRFRALRPELATRVDRLEDGPGWAAEVKWDGYRALALVTGDGTELRSRTGRDLTAGLPDIADLRRAVLCQEAVLDGEACVLDRDGIASFPAMQTGVRPVTYVVFDLLYADGEWLVDLPWSERRARLAAVLSPEGRPRVMLSDHVVGQASALFEAVRSRGVEGVVMKRMDAPYRPGRRSRDWLKVKAHQEIEAVVGGWTAGEGSRRDTLGALLVGRPEPGGLVFAGQVGSGLADRDLRSLATALRAIEAQECPFRDVPATTAPARWVRPELVCRVRFDEWTPDMRMRAPVLVGLPQRPPDPRAPEPPPLLDPAAPEVVVELGERRVRLTNLGKTYWPDEGISKRRLLEHYARVGGALLPHIRGRAMVLKRWPDGVTGEFFFQHALPDGAPDWLRRVTLSRREGDGKPILYAVVDDLASLLWVVNLGCIDLNPWHAPADRPDEPTWSLVDLDPADGLPFDRVTETALLVREELEGLGIEGFVKTSGAAGMHVMVPLPPGAGHGDARGLAGAVAARLVARRPDLVTTRRRVADRGQRVYLDVDQNGRGRTIASVYSVRPVPGASVSTPLAWDELRPGLDPGALGMAEAADRLARHGDLFAGVVGEARPIEAIRDAIGAAGRPA